MASVEEHISKLREERIAREKARIEKLRELNLKKYNAPQNQPTKPLLKSNSVTYIKSGSATNTNNNGAVKNNFHVNGTTKRPITVPVPKTNSQPTRKPSPVKKHSPVEKQSPVKDVKKQSPVREVKTPAKIEAKTNQVIKTSRVSVIPKIGDSKNFPGRSDKILANTKPVASQRQSGLPKTDRTKSNNSSAAVKTSKDNQPKISSRILTEITDRKDAKMNLSKFALKNSMRKSLAGPIANTEKLVPTRKSMLPRIDTNKESVFDRLYKPKKDHSIKENNIEKIQKDPNYLKKVIKTSGLILPSNPSQVRRSISAVHFKRINKNEITNCIHKWSSVSDRLNEINDEDDMITEEKVTSAVKSERKKVKFMSPMCLNTPRPEELQLRLKNWLKKRGKSLDSYHHLQCFGIHHLSKKIDPFDEENKENIAVESDSDDGSYIENMNEDNKINKKAETSPDIENMNEVKKAEISPDFDKWRRVSSVSESVDFNDSRQFNDTMTTETGSVDPTDIVMGALSDLVELLREGFDWRQSARWLRAIRERYPAVTGTAGYWECRAALEERRGDLPASVHCWEEAIAKGIGHSVVEANLDQLLDKFMQLKISPKSGTEKQPDPKMVDVKNVFKSTIIRFAVTQAKLRQSMTPVVCVTPVRRSGRLSAAGAGAGGASSTRVCRDMRQAAQLAPRHTFTPNPNLVHTP